MIFNSVLPDMFFKNWPALAKIANIMISRVPILRIVQSVSAAKTPHGPRQEKDNLVHIAQFLYQAIPAKYHLLNT